MAHFLPWSLDSRYNFKFNIHFPHTMQLTRLDSNDEGIPGPPHRVPLLEDSTPQPCSWEATFSPDLSIQGDNHDGGCNC